MKNKNLISGHEILGILVVSAVSGVAGALVVAGFTKALSLILAAWERLSSPVLFLVPVGGALVSGGLILRYFPGAGRDGTLSYIISVNRNGGKFEAADTIMKIPATLITLGSYGSGGIVGTLSRIGAGISALTCPALVQLLGIRYRSVMRAAGICGMSAIVSAIFHSPFGGALFAAEILSKNSLEYSDVFPAISAGCVATITSIAIGQSAVFEVAAAHNELSLHQLVLMPLAAVLSGGVGLLFIAAYRRSVSLFQKIPATQPAAALVAGISMAAVWLAGGGEVLSTSMPLFENLASGRADLLVSSPMFAGSLAGLVLLILILKLAVTSITVGSGMSGGLTGPLLVIGAACGALLSAVLGIPWGSSGYFAILCCCTAGILSSALNVPLAAILLAVAIFDRSYILSAAIGSFLSFLLFRTRTIFEYPSEAPGPEVPEEEIETAISGNNGE